MPKSRSLGLGNSKFQRPNRSSFRKFGETPWPQESKTESGPDFDVFQGIPLQLHSRMAGAGWLLPIVSRGPEKSIQRQY